MPETIEETVMRVAKESNGIVYGNIALLARRVQEALEPAKVPAPAEKPSYDELVTQEQSNACDASYERYLQNLKGAPRVHSEAFRAAWFQSLKNNWGATTLSTGTHNDLIRAEGLSDAAEWFDDGFEYSAASETARQLRKMADALEAKAGKP